MGYSVNVTLYVVGEALPRSAVSDAIDSVEASANRWSVGSPGESPDAKLTDGGRYKTLWTA